MASSQAFVSAIDQLAREGLNWVAYASADVGPPEAGLSSNQGILLFLGLGSAFAERTAYARGTGNPFDERAVSLVTPLLEGVLRAWDAEAHLVYPQPETNVNLMAWLAAARAQYSSRLGIGIRPDCGTWFAVRAAVVTHLPQDARTWLEARYPALDAEVSPCATCVGRPCEVTCPAKAPGARFDLQRCVDQRLEQSSPCATRCGARLACPVGHAYRYSAPQITYHYGVSLKMLEQWKERR